MKTWKSSLCAAAAGVATLLVLSTPAAAQWAVGDVFASVGNGQVNVYQSDGTLVTTLTAGGAGTLTTGGAFDAAGNYYVTNFTEGRIYKFDNTGALVTSWATGGTAPESITFDLAGNMYVGQAGGSAIREFDTSGNLLGTFNAAIQNRGTDWVDLSADQHTIFYTSEGNQVKRFDVATNTQLSDFSSALTGGGVGGVGGVGYALRLLGPGDGTGGLLAANTTDIKRLDGAGNVVQTYDVAGNDGWFSLNLDPNGTSFWSGSYDTGQLDQFNINTGTVLATINTGSSSLYGVTVYGEVTAGTGGGTITPEPSSVILLLTGLLGVGLLAYRRKERMTGLVSG